LKRSSSAFRVWDRIRASGLVALSAVVKTGHKQRPSADPTTEEDEERGVNLHDDRDEEDDDNDNDNDNERGEEAEDDDDMEYLSEHIKEALIHTPYIIACLQDPEVKMLPFPQSVLFQWSH
jgi:hypothetical protein